MLARAAPRRRAHPIANGCGTPTTAWVPDALAHVDFVGCCNQHDLDWAVGGTLGGILPWRIDGRWEWRFVRSNAGLSRCIRDRYVRGARPAFDRLYDAGHPIRAGMRASGLVAFGWLVGPAYFAATTLVGPVFWRWRSPTAGVMPTHQQLASLRDAIREGEIVVPS